MPTYESTVVRRIIEEHESTKDVDLNFRLVADGIDPYDAIVLEDILEVQDRIRSRDSLFFDIKRCTICEIQKRRRKRPNLSPVFDLNQKL